MTLFRRNDEIKVRKDVSLIWTTPLKVTVQEPDRERKVMVAKTRLVTAEELLDMPDDGYRYELVRGELRKMAPAGSEHSISPE